MVLGRQRHGRLPRNRDPGARGSTRALEAGFRVWVQDADSFVLLTHLSAHHGLLFPAPFQQVAVFGTQLPVNAKEFSQESSLLMKCLVIPRLYQEEHCSRHGVPNSRAGGGEAVDSGCTPAPRDPYSERPRENT